MNGRKVLLVYPGPDRVKSYRFGYSLLLLYVGADLRMRGYEPALFDYSVTKWDQDSFVQNVQDAVAVVVEVDAFPLKRSVNLRHAQEIGETVRRMSNVRIPVIAIGKQCTLSHVPYGFADVTISGDSEMSIADVLDCLLAGKSVSKFVDVGELIALNQLPVPAYDLLSSAQIRGQTTEHGPHLAPSALLETSRGCPGRCSFCQRKGWGRHVLAFPPERVADLYSELVDSGIRNIWLTDENFGASPGAEATLCAIARRRKGRDVRIAMSSWVHLDEKLLDLAKAAGVSIISFGIESADPEVQRFYHKPIDLAAADRLFAHADKLGIYTVGNFIIGAPVDTEETVRRTMDYALASPLDNVNVKTLDYMIGSELYESLPPEEKTEIHFFSCSERGTTELSAKTIVELRKEFETRFSLSRQQRLAAKMVRCGPPYHVEKRGVHG